jgi:uncharacterized protein YndB with AHSA1/START domain
MTAPRKPQETRLDKHEIVIVRRFAAPPALVFRNWTEAEALKDWFAPDTFTGLSAEADARPGGHWHVRYRSGEGTTVQEHGIFREIAAPDRVVMTLTQEIDGRAYPETVITVVLKAVGEETEMTFRQTGFETVERRDGNAEGWGGCFDKLARRLAR